MYNNLVIFRVSFIKKNYFQGFDCKAEIRIEKKIDGSYKVFTAPDKSIHNHDLESGKRKYADYEETKSDLRKNLNLEVKTRQIRNEVRDSVKADSNVTNPALQQKINRERKKLNLSSTKITLNKLKETCETNSSVPRDPKDPFVMAYDINDVSDGEDLQYCIIIKFPQSLHRCFLSLKHIPYSHFKTSFPHISNAI